MRVLVGIYMADLSKEWRPYFRQFRYVIDKHFEAIFFVYEHKLWRGIFRYGWLAKALLILGIIIGLRLFGVIQSWWQSSHFEDPEVAISSMTNLMSLIANESYSFLFAGSSRYMLLVLVEILIFHFSRRTVEILTAKPARADFQEFIQAQVRMLLVALRSWIMEIIVVFLIGLFLGLINFFNLWGIDEVVKPILVFTAQSFFTGFAVVDNYNEQFRMPINESFKTTVKLAGVSIGAGMIFQGLILIPLVGLVSGSILVAVAVSLAMFELTDLHKRTTFTTKDGMVPESIQVDSLKQ